MRGDVFLAEALGELEGESLGHAARIDEDESGAVLISELGDAVVDAVPDGVGGDGSEFDGWDFDGEVEGAVPAALNDFDVGVARAAEEAGDEFNGILRGGEADALRRGMGEQAGAWGEGIFGGDEGVKAFEREGQVGTALVVSDGMNFIDDDGVDAAEMLAAFERGEQDVERFGSGDENVWRALEHGAALGGWGVSGADGGADGRAEVAAFEGELLDFAEGSFEVFLDVVGERLEGRDVDDGGSGGEAVFEGFAEEAVNADEERGEGFAGAGGRGDERGCGGEDVGPALLLGFGGRAEAACEPLLSDGVGPCERVGNGFGGGRVRHGLLYCWFCCLFANSGRRGGCVLRTQMPKSTAKTQRCVKGKHLSQQRTQRTQRSATKIWRRRFAPMPTQAKTGLEWAIQISCVGGGIRRLWELMGCCARR